MTEFSINAENVKRLEQVNAISKEIASKTNPIFILSPDKLTVNLLSQKNAMKYSVDIFNYVKDSEIGTELDYFSIPIDDFFSALRRVSYGGDVKVIIERNNGDRTKCKVKMFNSITGAKIALPSFSDTSDNDATEAVSFISNLKTNVFTNNATTVSITPEIVNFFDMSAKFMSRDASSNAILINGTTVKYAGTTAIITETLNSSATSNNEDIYLQKPIMEFVKSIVKTGENVSIIFNEDKNMVYIESSSLGFTAVMTLEEIQFVYPSDEEYNAIVPESSSMVKIKMNKSDIHKAFELFSGTFKPENWRVGQITFDSSKDNLDKNIIHFEHSDYTAECMLDVPCQLVEKTEADEDTKFILGSLYAGFIIDNLGDEITLTYNNIDPNSEHGAGFILESGNIKAVSLKFIEG